MQLNVKVETAVRLASAARKRAGLDSNLVLDHTADTGLFLSTVDQVRPDNLDGLKLRITFNGQVLVDERTGASGRQVSICEAFVNKDNGYVIYSARNTDWELAHGKVEIEVL